MGRFYVPIERPWDVSYQQKDRAGLMDGKFGWSRANAWSSEYRTESHVTTRYIYHLHMYTSQHWASNAKVSRYKGNKLVNYRLKVGKKIAELQVKCSKYAQVKTLKFYMKWVVSWRVYGGCRAVLFAALGGIIWCMTCDESNSCG